MKPIDCFRALIEAVLWYAFIYFFIYTIKAPYINLYVNCLILLILVYLAAITCPWIKYSNAWRRLWGKSE